MKTFADVKFNNDVSEIYGSIDLNNGYEIVITMAIEGNNKGLWAAAVFPINSIHGISMKCFGNRNFIGYFTFNELEEKIIEIQKEFNNIEK